jgi:hypothetical protein
MRTDALARRDQLIQRVVTTALVALAASLVCVGLLLYV